MLATCFNIFQHVSILSLFEKQDETSICPAPGVAQVPWHGSAAVPSQVERRGVAAAAPGRNNQKLKNAINQK